MPKILNEYPSYTQADGAIEIKSPSWHSDTCQVSFDTDSTTGTIAVTAKYHPLAKVEVLYEEDGTTPLVIDLTDLKTFQLKDKWCYSLIFTPTDVDESYKPLVISGEFY